MSYTSVLKEGKFTTKDYLLAVTYVSYKLMGDTNQDAYMKTFPQRHARLVANGSSPKDISAYVSAYNRGKLVNIILEQCMVPSWVLNQDLHQKAINRLADLMVNAQSEKVQSDSANALLTHLKKPEKSEFQIDLNVKDTSGMNEMKAALEQMAQRQQEMIAAGMTPKQIAASPIIEHESVSNGSGS